MMMASFISIYAFILGIIHNWPTCMTQENINELMTQNFIVPELIERAPENWCTVQFPTGVKFEAGEYVRAKGIRRIPTVTWDAKENGIYTIFMYGLSKYLETFRMQKTNIGTMFLHWMVADIPGPNVDKGVTWYDFRKPLIPPETITTRYVILVYEQKYKFNITNAKAIYGEYFEYFPPLQVFAHNNSMGEPIAGNFCRIRELAMKR